MNISMIKHFEAYENFTNVFTIHIKMYDNALDILDRNLTHRVVFLKCFRKGYFDTTRSK